jgi:hypothetical protein
MLGWFHEAVTAPVAPPLSDESLPLGDEPCVLEQAVTSLEFLEYGSWAAFVAHCCCMPRAYQGSAPLVELWACDNGQYKERARRLHESDLLSPVRQFCATEFAGGAEEPAWVASAQRIGVAYDGRTFVDYW